MLGPAAARVDDRIQESKLQISLCLCVTVVKRFSVRQFRSSAVWQCKHFRNSAILIVVLIASCVAPAFARSWRISNFDSSIVVAKNGSAIVTERISLVFVGQFNGIHRYIPRAGRSRRRIDQDSLWHCLREASGATAAAASGRLRGECP